MQHNSPGAARGGPVVLRPIRATPYFTDDRKPAFALVTFWAI